MSTLDLTDLLAELDSAVTNELAAKPDVVPAGDTLDLDDLAITARRWSQISDVVAVCADLKNSTRLGTGKHAGSTASIYQAATGGLVKVFNQFEADFLQIQGDGVFALFWGERRYERALCAAITVKTFSAGLVDRLEVKWPEMPETGFKVGVASSRLLVKKVGTPRNPAEQEPVWAGKAVNYATKAAQGADRHELVVTAGVWKKIEANDYLRFSCPCGHGASDGLWTEATIERLPDGDPDREGRVVRATWCDIHGCEFCAAVMAGAEHRDDVAELRKVADAARMQNAMLATRRIVEKGLAARRRGLAR